MQISFTRKILVVIIIAQVLVLIIAAKYEGNGYRQLSIAACILTITGLVLSLWSTKK